MSTDLQSHQNGSAKPVDFFNRFRQEMDDFISNFTGGLAESPFTIALGDKDFAVDVAESNGSVEVTAELPGIASDDVEVTVEGGSLLISAKKEAETKSEDKNWQRVERSYGSFRRVIPLGFIPDPDKLNAELKKGVLSVKIPKPADKLAEAKKIAVKTA